MHSKVFVGVNTLDIPLDGYWGNRRLSPVEVHSQLLQLTSVQLQVVQSAPPIKVVHQASVFLLLLSTGTPQNGSNQRTSADGRRVVGEVRGVKSKQEGGEDGRGALVLLITVPNTHFFSLTNCGLVRLSITQETNGVFTCMALSSSPNSIGYYGVKSTGEIKEHDLHCTTSTVQVRISTV